MSEIELSAGGPLRGTLRVPGDKSISHRSLIFGALASGKSVVTGLSKGTDVASTRGALEAMGAVITADGNTITIEGGKDRLHEPEDVLDLGNAGTGFRLMVGFCAARPWVSVMTGDASLRTRTMMRVVEPLRRMGAHIDGRNGGDLAPLTIRGGNLKGIDFTPIPGTAQPKSAVLIAGLDAEGETVINESLPGRMHTEEMFTQYGADIETHENNDGSCVTKLRPSSLNPFVLDVPGDPSQAAFWMVAALVVPDSDITIENIYVGPGRSGLIDVLMRMGGDIEMTHRSSSAVDLRIRHSKLKATEVGGDEVPSLIDELPILSVAAAVAEGTTVVTDAAEMRVKESDRIAAVAKQIGGLGIKIDERPDGFLVHGNNGASIAGGRVEAHLDHRIAMTGAIAALVSENSVAVNGWDSVSTSYPSFIDDLEALQGKGNLK